MPSVTVAICTWNRARSLERVLTAMADLRIPPGTRWEVVVVNNNSTDDTDAVITRHTERIPLRRLFEPVPGISHARNRAVAETVSDFLLWIDDDALPHPDWLSAHLEAFNRFHADLVIGKVDPLWETGTPPRWFVREFYGMFALLDYGDEPRIITDPRESGFNVNLGFRRELVDSIGIYRLDIGTGRRAGGEDQDLCRRAHDAGKVVVYQPHAVVQHIIPKARCSKRFYRNYIWSGSQNHLQLLRDEPAQVPRLLGLPRYFLRKNLEYLGKYLSSLATRRRDAFYYELKLIRLVGLYWSMFVRTDPLRYTRRIGE